MFPDRHLHSIICVIVTVSEFNSPLAFLLYIRIIVLTHDHFILIGHFVSYLIVQKFPFCKIASYNTFSHVKFMSFSLVIFMSC